MVPATRFASVRDAWQGAAERSGASVAVGADYVAALLDTLGDGREVVALRSGRDGPDAAAVLRRTGRGVWTTFNPSEVCVGLWIQSVEADLAALASGLLGALPGLPVALAVLQLDPAVVARPAETGRLRTLDHFRTAWIDVAGGFDDYWAARGKNLRANTKKARGELGRIGVTPVLEVATEPSGVGPALSEYARLEAAGWKGKSGTAMTPDGPEGRFYRRLLEQACAKRGGEIYRYRAGDRAVAMDLCLRDRGTLIVLKTAYDEEWAKVSPASLMREEQLRRLFADGETRRVEFYGPLMEWHTRWTQQSRMLYHANCYRLPLLSWAHGLARARRAKAAAGSGDASARRTAALRRRTCGAPG